MTQLALDGMAFPSLTALDLAALIWFVVAWSGFALATDRGSLYKRSLSAHVNDHRLEWMRRMMERDIRIGDTNLVGNLMRSVAFFASTSVLILGGLAALLGTIGRLPDNLGIFPLWGTSSAEGAEIKVLLLALIFVYAFFKFTWALRQFNYCCVLMGAAPSVTDTVADEATEQAARRAARINELAGRSFNEGLRGYYFALAAMLWFVHPIAFAMGTIFVVLILFRREFHSKTLAALKG